jgi:hypothetical protein
MPFTRFWVINKQVKFRTWTETHVRFYRTQEEIFARCFKLNSTFNLDSWTSVVVVLTNKVKVKCDLISTHLPLVTIYFNKLPP